MAMIFTQTDTDGVCGTADYCQNITPDPPFDAQKQCSVGGSAGSTPVTVTVGASTNRMISFECVVPAGTSWDAGDWTLRLNVTTANMNLTWGTGAICRVSSGCVNQANIDSYNAAQSLGSTGVKSFTTAGLTQTPSAGDKVIIGLVISNGAMSDQSFAFTPDQNIDSPFTAVTQPNPNVNDSVTVTESVSMMLNPMLFNVNDTATVTESVKMNMLLLPQPFDTVTVTEHVNMNLVNNIGVFDTVTVTEDARVHILVMPSVFDSVTVAESVTALLTSLNISTDDTVTLTESVNVTLNEGVAGLSVDIFDTVTVTEDARVHIFLMPTVNDSVTVTEATQRNMLLFPRPFDSVTVTDAPQLNMLVMPSVFDTVTTTESVTVSVVSVSAIQINAFDSITVADASTVLLPFLALFVSDSITVTEDITVTESGGVSPGTINYQGDGKSNYRRRRNRTQELFDDIEATLRAKMRGDVEIPAIGAIATDDAVVQKYADMPIKEAVRQLTIASKGYAELTNRLTVLKRELRQYEAEQRMRREIDDEEAFVMMGY
jgi:hypothetical protein